MALEIMAEHKDESTPGKAKILQSVGPRLAARYPGEEISLPKRSTAYRWLAELERRQPTFEVSGERRRDIAGRPPAAYGKLRPSRPGEYLLMDTTRLDVFALDQLTFRWVQPELSVAMDWYSRCITGLRVTPVSTKSVDIAATLFQAYRPRPAGADWPAYAAWPDHGIPRGIVLDRDAIEGPMAEAARQGGAASPALVPETLVVDHGKVYVSEHITSVCQRMGISIQPARLRTGRDKGPVERYFRTLREGLLQWLPAYKGPDVYSRGLDPEGPPTSSATAPHHPGRASPGRHAPRSRALRPGRQAHALPEDQRQPGGVRPVPARTRHTRAAGGVTAAHGPHAPPGQRPPRISSRFPGTAARHRRARHLGAPGDAARRAEPAGRRSRRDRPGAPAPAR